MYITNIVLDSVRCFEHVEIDLTSGRTVKKWAMILGDNSVGKTTFLRCIAMGLCDEASAVLPVCCGLDTTWIKLKDSDNLSRSTL